MTMTIDTTPEVETRLEQKARRHGQPLNDYVRDLLERDAGAAGGKRPQLPQPDAEASPLAAFLTLAEQLDPIIRIGTSRTFKAADVIEANREERMRDIAPRS